MNVRRQTLFEGASSTAAKIYPFSVGQASTLKLEFAGNAIFDATLLAKNRDKGEFVVINAFNDTTLAYSAIAKTNGIYTVDCAGYAYVSVLINSITSGELSCYGTGVIS